MIGTEKKKIRNMKCRNEKIVSYEMATQRRKEISFKARKKE